MVFTVQVWAVESYCLSGGTRSAYSCAQIGETGQPLARERYAVQVLVDARNQAALAEVSFPSLHEVQITDNRRLVYLGGFDALPEGQQALDTVTEELGLDFSPMLVAFTPREPLPLIRLVQEPDGAVLRLAQARLQDLPAPASGTQQSDMNESQYDLVYSIQIGAFKFASFGQRFAKKHGAIPLQCRQKDNGIFAVYYGLYENFADAKGHLKDYPLLDKLGAYVVKLRNVTFSACDALAARIEQSRQQAYGDSRCGGRQGCDINAATQQYLPQLPGVQ
ncbi:hypothetical protein R50073_44880 [Maricurvus nonylphenolicus]